MSIIGIGVFLLILGIVFEIFKVAVAVSAEIVGIGIIVLIVGVIYNIARGIR